MLPAAVAAPRMASHLGLLLAVLAAAQLAVGLALQFVVLVVVGVGAATDAYIAAQTVPLLVFGMLVMPLQALWLPRLSVLAHEPALWRVAHGLAQGQLLLLLGAVALALAASAGWWVKLVFPGLDAAHARLTVDMTRLLLIGALFNGQVALMTAALRARDRFVVAECVSLVVSLAAVAATVAVIPHHGVMAAAAINVARAAVIAALLYAFTGLPRIAALAAARPGAPWRGLRPLLAGASVYKCEPLVDRYLASSAPSGGLTILALAQTGIGAAAQVIERSLCMPIVPHLARLAAAGDHAGMRALVRRCIWRVSAGAALCALLLAAAHPFWNAAMHSAFKLPAPVAAQMWLVCLVLIGYLHVSASGSVPVAAFYALGDTTTPVRLSIVSFVIGVAAKALAFAWFGVVGLACATSAYYLLNLVVVSLVLESRLNDASRQR